MIVGGTIATIAWGAFAFGSVYPWAYTILGIACAVVGAAALVFGSRRLKSFLPLFVGLGAVVTIGLVQLIPLPSAVLAKVSPSTDRFLRAYDLAYSAGTRVGPDDVPEPTAVRHAISLDVASTARSLALFGALALLLAGLLRALSGDSIQSLTRGLVWVGVALALVGIVQKALLGDHAFAGMKIYGFWTPQSVLTTPFGPYVNKNHFAGWMLMVIPVAFGLAMAAIERSASELGHGFRHRILWLAAPEGGRVLLVIFAALLMALSLVMTQSRSALGCLAVIVVIAAIFMSRQMGSRAGRFAVMAGLAAFFLIALVWAGTDTAVGRLTTETGSVDLRLNIWRVAAQIMRDFPVLGTGLNTFGLATILYEVPGQPMHYRETHNDYFQLLAEGGVVLGVVVLFIIGVVVRTLIARFNDDRDRRRDAYWVRVGATIGLIAIALQSAVEFSLQMPGNAAAFVVLLVLALHRPSRRTA